MKHCLVGSYVWGRLVPRVPVLISGIRYPMGIRGRQWLFLGMTGPGTVASRPSKATMAGILAEFALRQACPTRYRQGRIPRFRPKKWHRFPARAKIALHQGPRETDFGPRPPESRCVDSVLSPSAGTCTCRPRPEWCKFPRTGQDPGPVPMKSRQGPCPMASGTANSALRPQTTRAVCRSNLRTAAGVSSRGATPMPHEPAGSERQLRLVSRDGPIERRHCIE